MRRWGWFPSKRFSLGAEKSVIDIRGEKYMTRYIAYVGPFTLRLHKFWRGDDDRAPHDHPWPFITFPLKSYWEEVYTGKDGDPELNYVRAFRFHFRPASYRHIVLGGRVPFWTVVVTLPLQRLWGFWPRPNAFVPYFMWGTNR